MIVFFFSRQASIPASTHRQWRNCSIRLKALFCKRTNILVLFSCSCRSTYLELQILRLRKEEANSGFINSSSSNSFRLVVVGLPTNCQKPTKSQPNTAFLYFRWKNFLLKNSVAKKVAFVSWSTVKPLLFTGDHPHHWVRLHAELHPVAEIGQRWVGWKSFLSTTLLQRGRLALVGRW